MKLKFTKMVRDSLAAQIIKISTFGGIGFGLLGYSKDNPLLLIMAVVWWIFCQIVAHLIMSVEDE